MRLAGEELREEGATDPAALRGGPDVQLDDLEVRRIEPVGALGGRERTSDAFSPPLAVGPRVAVAEACDLVALPRDEKDEVVALDVAWEALTRPVVGQGTRAERRAVDLTQFGRERQRVDGLDYERGSVVSEVPSRSRSTRQTTTALSTMNTARPSHRLISDPTTINAK